MVDNNVEKQLRALAAPALQRENEKFVAWLKQGEARAEDARELYEFCMWVADHDAYIAGASPHDVVAADGPDERRFSPDGGLRAGHWPYLKALCAAVAYVDETVAAQDKLADVDRDEIVRAILENDLRKRGRAILPAKFAVDEKATKTDAAGVALWFVVEKQGFQQVVDDLDARVEEVSEDLEAQQNTWKEAFLAKPQSPYLFRFGGKIWYLRFPGDYGDKVHEYGETNGLLFYAKLLERKGKPATADDFYEIDRAKLGPKFKAEKVITKYGKQTAHDAVDRLTEEIKDAKEKGDWDEVEKLQEKRNAIQDAIEKDEDTIFVPSEIEDPPRAAERVMRDAILEIGHDMPKLARYLHSTCRKTDRETWLYDPVENIEWELGPLPKPKAVRRKPRRREP